VQKSVKILCGQGTKCSFKDLASRDVGSTSEGQQYYFCGKELWSMEINLCQVRGISQLQLEFDEDSRRPEVQIGRYIIARAARRAHSAREHSEQVTIDAQGALALVLRWTGQVLSPRYTSDTVTSRLWCLADRRTRTEVR
jgi:hypothetical protein